MKTAADLRNDLNQRTKKQSVREIRSRTDLTTELLASNKISSALAQATSPVIRDISFKEELAGFKGRFKTILGNISQDPLK